MNIKLLDEILKELPKEKISSVEFEAANIVIYTIDKDFLFNGRDQLRKIVSKFKKRIALRADPTILLTEEETKEKVKGILKDVNMGNFLFEPARSTLTIEVDNVGSAVGQGGSNLREIQKQTHWSVNIRRIPPMRSVTVDTMRAVEFQESEYRRKFLNNVGKRIYGGWKSGKIRGWSKSYCFRDQECKLDVQLGIYKHLKVEFYLIVELIQQCLTEIIMNFHI